MSNFRNVTNKITGQTEKQFSAKLVSIADAPMQNKTTGKDYYPCTIEFVNANGQIVQRTAIVYGANKSYGMEVGSEYMATAQQGVNSKGEPAVYVHLSHLTFVNGATEDDFDFDAEVDAPAVREKELAEFN